MTTTKHERALIRAENRKYPKELIAVHPDNWPKMPAHFISGALMRHVWRSRDFLVQIFDAGEGRLRLSVNRTEPTETGLAEGITWDDLQRLKREAGYKFCPAVEVYPPDQHIVNDANIRHLWVFTKDFPASIPMWKINEQGTTSEN